MKSKNYNLSKKIEKLLKDAAMDLDMECPFCDQPVYEPDYDRCQECGKKNPLKQLGFI